MSARRGILDWGIGGVGVLRALRERGVDDDVVYLSDAGVVPYGKQGRAALRTRLAQVAALFAREGAADVVVACNAASCALDGDDEMFETPSGSVVLHGIVPAAVAAAAASPARRIGVLGGGRTIASGVYQERLPAAGARALRFAVAQPLSAFVEAGRLDGDDVVAAVRAALDALGDVDAVLLACTHYPALAPVFARLGAAPLLDPAAHVAVPPRAARARGAPGASLRFLTTGDPAAARVSASRAFGVDVGDARRVGLDFA